MIARVDDTVARKIMFVILNMIIPIKYPLITYIGQASRYVAHAPIVNIKYYIELRLHPI